VPLSDHEQKLLEQMEQALFAEDPKFASVLQGSDLRVRYRRRMAFAVLGFILGVVLLMSGLVAKLVVISVIGFLAMLVSVLAAISAYRRTPARDSADATPPSMAKVTQLRPVPSRRGLMARLEERWQRRRDEDGR
jgi:hypothetical protein